MILQIHPYKIKSIPVGNIKTDFGGNDNWERCVLSIDLKILDLLESETYWPDLALSFQQGFSHQDLFSWFYRTVEQCGGLCVLKIESLTINKLHVIIKHRVTVPHLQNDLIAAVHSSITLCQFVTHRTSEGGCVISLFTVFWHIFALPFIGQCKRQGLYLELYSN